MKKKWMKRILTTMLGAVVCISAPVWAEESDNTEQVSAVETVGYFDDNGYYNPYFGFKLEIPADENDSFNTSEDMVSEWIKACNNIDLSSDVDLTETLGTLLETRGGAVVYDPMGMPVTKNGENFGVAVYVNKMDEGMSNDTYLSSVKDNISYGYTLQEGEITSEQISFAGEERDCFIWTSKDNSQMGKMILFSEEYVCIIDLGGFSSFETVCSYFEMMTENEQPISSGDSSESPDSIILTESEEPKTEGVETGLSDSDKEKICSVVEEKLQTEYLEPNNIPVDTFTIPDSEECWKYFAKHCMYQMEIPDMDENERQATTAGLYSLSSEEQTVMSFIALGYYEALETLGQIDTIKDFQLGDAYVNAAKTLILSIYSNEN